MDRLTHRQRRGKAPRAFGPLVVVAALMLAVFTTAQPALAAMLDEIPDGQLFWIIRHGSPDTAMPAYKKLSDRSIWRIILYLRTLGKPK